MCNSLWSARILCVFGRMLMMNRHAFSVFTDYASRTLIQARPQAQLSTGRCTARHIHPLSLIRLQKQGFLVLNLSFRSLSL